MVTRKPRADRHDGPGVAYAATLVRGLSVLRCFDQSNGDLGVSDIVRITKIPQPTVWRLCRTLEAEGFLVADESGTRFRPGLAVLGLGFAALGAMGLPEFARPDLARIAADFHSVAGLAVPEGLQMRYIQRQQAPDAVLTFNIRLGRTLPVSISSSGWAYLAALDDKTRAATVRKLAREQTTLWNRAEADFEIALKAFRQTGIMVNVDTFYPGLTSVAVPIVSPRTNAVYAVYCTGLSSILTRKVVANELGRRLGDLAATLHAAMSVNPALE